MGSKRVKSPYVTPNSYSINQLYYIQRYRKENLAYEALL